MPDATKDQKQAQSEGKSQQPRLTTKFATFAADSARRSFRESPIAIEIETSDKPSTQCLEEREGVSSLTDI